MKRIIDLETDPNDIYFADTEVFDYLDILRESGKINMLGACPYIMKEFKIDKPKARAIIIKWINLK
tara:strand:+ start:3210 stop:3407 length:198 start_codon:yes stop_codon:yes gene_type:complete